MVKHLETKRPPKVRFFAWKLSKNILPTKQNKCKRRLEVEDTCDLCGLASETSFHAVVSCPRANDIRQAMRNYWLLPDEEQFVFSGPDWLLLLLDWCDPEPKENTLLMLWIDWSVHNNITHNSGPSGVTISIHALLSLKASPMEIRQQIVDSSNKGQMQSPSPSALEARKKLGESATSLRTSAGWVKINVDALFIAETGRAGAGIIGRDSAGMIKFTAWRALFHCGSAVEAEALACVEGVRLASQWCQEPIVLESDCERVVQALLNKHTDRSEIGFIAECKELAQLLVPGGMEGSTGEERK